MSLEALPQIIGVLSFLSALIALAFTVYFIFFTKKLNPNIVFATLTAKVFVSRIYRGVVFLALLSIVFIYASYLTRYFLHDKLLENILQSFSILTFLIICALGLVTQHRMKTKRQPNNRKS